MADSDLVNEGQIKSLVTAIRRRVTFSMRTPGDTLPRILSDFSGVLATNVVNLAEHRINGALKAWQNEWGALRGVSPYAWGDALVRAIREVGDGITSGSWLELVDRRVNPSKVMWSVGWDGKVRVYGYDTSPVHTTADWATDPANPANGGELPADVLIADDGEPTLVSTQRWTTAGTYDWTIPTGAKALRMRAVGGGGGGGSGRRGAASTVRCGGGGGGGGGLGQNEIWTADLPGGTTQLRVVVGAGGLGGDAVAANSTNGNAGAVAGSSYVQIGPTSQITSSLCRGNGGSGGAGGTASNGTAGAGASGTWNGGTGAAASTTGATGGSATGNPGAPGGGGAGGGVTSANAVAGGGTGAGVGGAFNNSSTAGTGGGSAPAVSIPPVPLPGNGGGGGASSITAAAGAGADGVYGGGGGGGGASLDGFNSGKGGKGGDGYVEIVVQY